MVAFRIVQAGRAAGLKWSVHKLALNARPQ